MREHNVINESDRLNGNQREEHQGLLIQSNNNFSYKSYERPRNMLYYSYKGQGHNSRLFIPFLMCFLPFVNSLMLIFLIYAISSIEQNATVLTNPNVTSTITKIENIINYLCENNIVKC